MTKFHVVYIEKQSITLYELNTNTISKIYETFEINRRFIQYIKNSQVYIIIDQHESEFFSLHEINDQLNFFEKSKWKRNIEKEYKEDYIKINISNDKRFIAVHGIKKNNIYEKTYQSIYKYADQILGIFSQTQIIQSMTEQFAYEKDKISKNEFYLIVLDVYQDRYQHLICKNNHIYTQRIFESDENKSVFRNFLVDNDSQETIKYANQELDDLEENFSDIKIICLTHSKNNENDIDIHELSEHFGIKPSCIEEFCAQVLTKKYKWITNFQNKNTTILNKVSQYKLNIFLAIFFIYNSTNVADILQVKNDIKEKEKNFLYLQDFNKKKQKELSISPNQVKRILSMLKLFNPNMNKLFDIIDSILSNIPENAFINSIYIENFLTNIEIKIEYDDIQTFCFKISDIMQDEPTIMRIHQEYIAKGRLR